MFLQARRIGWDLGSLGLGLFTAALPGWPLAAVTGLGLALGWRRWRWRPRPWPPRLVAAATVAVVAALAVVGVGWWIAEVATAQLRARPLDFEAAEVPLIRGAVFVGAVPGVLALYAAMRLGEEWLTGRAIRIAAWIGKVAGLVLVLVGSLQLFSDQMIHYYGELGPLAAIVAFVVVAGGFVPRERAPGRGIRAGLAAGTVAAVLLGVAGLHHAGTRSLLFHDPRTYPRAFDAVLGALDGDGDGDYPTWAGGTDCDDADPLAAGWRVEIPGNGRDDNCRLGDRPERPSPPSSPAGDGPRPPIFLITIDTVSASHLELHGYPRTTMPALSAMARHARWYRRAYSPSNQTYYSTVATLSGQSPERMLRPPDGGDPDLLRFTFWLPHRLAQLGYRTVAVAPPLYDLQKMTVEELRFDTIDMTDRDWAPLGVGTTSKAVVDAALRHLEVPGDARPGFFWIHFVDPHARHEAPGVFPVDDPSDHWDSELAYVDVQLARLLGAIDDRHGEDVIVVVTADHGEQFGERGFFGHAYSLFEDVIHVPLVVHAPGLPPGEETRPVSVLGVVPTILALLGQPTDARLSSPPLLPDVDPGPVLSYSPRYAEAERRMEVALIEARHKLVYARSRGTALLFDLEADPSERRNLSARDPASRERLEQRLFELLEAEP
jgi:arylsulfatase A-like enzyme